MINLMSSEAAQVTRWKRDGKDRLYIALADSTKVGYWDLVTDEPHPMSGEYLSTVLTAVEHWKATLSDGAALTATATATAAAPAPVQPDPAPVILAAADSPPPRPWLDLTANEAGAEAREQAIAARQAAPVKTLLARVLRVHTDERAWRIGADGEERVAAQLAKIAKKDPRWQIIHAIPVGSRGSDIDHVIIGPGGVFTVNAKHHPNAKIWAAGSTFLVNGHKQPYIRNSRYEATRAQKLLTDACGFPVHVEGLIVPVNADDVVVKSLTAGVHVVPRRQVAKWVLRHGDILPVDAVQGIYDVARRSTTWQP